MSAEAIYEQRSDVEHRIASVVAHGGQPAELVAEWKRLDNKVKQSMGLDPQWNDDGSVNLGGQS